MNFFVKKYLKMRVKSKISYLMLLMCILIVNCNKPVRDLNPETLVGGFELLSSEKTGIDFNNKIKETEMFNHFYFAQIYNGAGVAIGDLNNDGLPDIYFCGNQVNDRLYLNKGDFKFEDITKKSRAARNPGWSWGVTMADVNADGYLDIYVSRHGLLINPEDRKNQLYINNQDLTFTESAMKYGLADTGFSTQAVFFDMDNDGDLDMYQVNQPADQKLFLKHKFNTKQGEIFKDRLYENRNGRYYDVSLKAGISQKFAYGLSVNATDFNNDGFTDLYVSNDYDEPDAMYYNNGDGTFRNVIDENMKHFSRFSMGSDTGDINNDGLMDLFTIDMSSEDHFRSKTNMKPMSSKDFHDFVAQGKHYQYMVNTLQLNTGMGSFSDIGNLSGVSRTDWSWSTLMVDLDNDGLKDVIVSNGIKKDVLNNDYLSKVNSLSLKITHKEFFEVSKNTPSQPLSNYAFKNKGNVQFEKVSKDWGFATPSFSSGMAYADLDNDGDLDIVINNMESEAFVYKNKATGNFLKIELKGSEKNQFGYGAKATISHNGKTQVANNTVSRGYLSSVESGFFFGLGKDVRVDSVKVEWPDGKINVYENVSANEVLTAKHSKAKLKDKTNEESKTLMTKIEINELGIDFKHQENKYDEYQEEVLLPHNVSQNGPFTAVADVNGDNLDDLFIGGASGQSGVLYLQTDNERFVENSSQPWNNDKVSEDLGALFLDVDGDGDMDLFVASGGSEFKPGDARLKDRLYINDGKGRFVKNSSALPNIFESSQCVKTADIDSDGDLDLFVGTRLIYRQYGFPATSYLLINDGGVFKKAPEQNVPDLSNIGMVTDAVFTDIDQDQDADLIIVGEWMAINVLINNKGVFQNKSKAYGLENTRGLWWSITADDLDNDGDDDYIIGNLGKNNKFKASKEHPFKIYANDFDDNGTNDIVLAKFYKDDYVPVRGRECTSQQMPFVAEKFKDFNSFASSKLLDILPDDKVKGAVVYEISNFESIVLINDNGNLKQQSLPIETQFSPLKSSLVMDFNGDGYKDIVTTGNHYGVEIETTRYDAGNGTVLLGDGNNNFKFLPPTESGFFTPQDSRDLNIIKQKSNDIVIVTNNDDTITSFKK
ncbi:hypothetical protein DIS18_05070 [Algibacter marinivivus]|uniref:ASPIC/UnbV domain-containing protein n=2 Tax=Algibacter marinivivus TaxID=2100723 RepID=A0A2U2X816_9FLAO|nr:hypothetical protein DIS18_05070 [Algibacter marinivivus]